MDQVVFDEAFWDSMYRDRDHLWSGNPNKQLVDEITGYQPGTALDVGSGEGGDAIWLTQQGWRVTGVDISSVALEKAAQHTRELGIDVTWRHADFGKQPSDTTYDLVSAHYVHTSSAEEREQLHRNLAAAVKPGGTLLIVGHHPDDIANVPDRPQDPQRYLVPEMITSVLPSDDWTVQVAEVRTHTRSEHLLTDTVFKAMRRR